MLALYPFTLAAAPEMGRFRASHANKPNWHWSGNARRSMLAAVQPCRCGPMNTVFRFKHLLLALIVFTGFAGVAVNAARAADHATVLMYHRFGEADYPSTNVTIAQFEEHLEVLASGAYSVLPLEDIVARLRSRRTASRPHRGHHDRRCLSVGL